MIAMTAIVDQSAAELNAAITVALSKCPVGFVDCPLAAAGHGKLRSTGGTAQR
jgi:hypothetical protein